MQDEDNEKKLNELNLDEFAVNMFEAEDRKWHTLNVIRAELLKPFSEQRAPFPTLGNWDVLTMLSGETLRTLRAGLIISVQVTRIKDNFVSVRLDSGIEGMINAQYLADHAPVDPKVVVKKGQSICASRKTLAEPVQAERRPLVQVVLLVTQHLVTCLCAILAELPTRILDLVLRVGPLRMVVVLHQFQTMGSLPKTLMRDIKRHQHIHHIRLAFLSQPCLGSAGW